MNNIYFHDFKTGSGLTNKRALKEFLRHLFERQKIQLERADIIFCTSQYLRSLNKKFLDHDYNTDTITFILSESKKPILGEAYISVDQVHTNAKYLNIPYKEELVRVIIHSCLHLCGFNDKSKGDSHKMNKIQEKYIKQWLVSRET